MRQTYALAVWLFLYLLLQPIQAPCQARRALYPAELFNPAYFQELQWRNIGPFRGGRSVAVAGVVQQPLTFYMGSTGGGLWKTEDAGTTWNNISDGFFRTGSVGAIAVAPSDPNIVYVGMGEHAVRGTMTTHGDGVYKSTDGGETWTHIGLTESRHIADIEVHPDNPDLLFVAVQGALHGPSECRGVYRSDDGGQSWCKVLYIDNTTGACDLSLDPANPRILYAGMWDHRRYPWSVRSGGPGSGLFKSTDSGNNWERLANGLPGEMGKVAIDVSPANPKIVYANIEALHGGVFRSEDGGRTWRQTSADRITVARAWYYIEVFADPRDPQTVYVLNEPLLKSVDGGRSFEEISTPHGDQHDLWINPDHPSFLILANDGGATISFNGGSTWSSQNNQPTGQFYRVIADNRFPYYLYGAQQDNTTVAIPSRTQDAGISRQDWYPAGGCESGFLAMDPDNPERIYGGCYQGYIEVFDQETQLSRDISAYPALRLAAEPKDMKYRFNWNAPILVSPHDPNVVYHAANQILRTEDGGQSWREISPDLTRNEPDKQGPGGGPFTNEGAGAENYNTISYLACSPYEAGLLWAGSDDGLVHLTRNEGQSWENVTPKELGEAVINCIEVSPHNPATAYIVAHRYRFNDLRPMIFFTSDYGNSWSRIKEGIAGNHFVRVVREDPKRPGLLYAGTEGGMYISFDQGRQWHRFQLNLPICPITDLTIHDNDLIASTSGRGFWILDDLGPLQQSMGVLPRRRAVLFQPKPTVRFTARETYEKAQALGANPPNGVIINYYLPWRMDQQELTLQILDHNQRLVRTFTNQPDSHTVEEDSPEPENLLPAQQGVNRFYWDLRRTPIPGVPDIFVYGSYHSGLVAPGKYRLRLISPSDTLEQPFEIVADPRLSATPEDYARQQEALRQVESAVRDIHQSVKRMRVVKKQVAFLTKQMQKAGCADELIHQGKAVQKRINDWEKHLIQPLQKTDQDVINYPNRLNAEFISLIERLDTLNPEVTDGARRRMQDLLESWQEYKSIYHDILDKDVSRFNRIYKEQDLPVVVIPSSAD